MQRTCIIILLAVVVAVLVGAAADERSAKLAFEERYGPQMRRVMASRMTDDDAMMALELIAAAKAASDNPAMTNELCENAFVLGMRDPQSYDAAIEAMELLATKLPDKAAAAREKVVTALRRVLLTAKGEEHQATSQRLVSFLTRLGDERAAASDFGGAARQYQLAVKAAEDGKIADIAELKAKFDAAAAREKLELRLEAANEKLATDPTSMAASAELLAIYLIEFDSPSDALRYVKHGGTDTAKALLPLAAGPIDALTAKQAMDVAEWYETMIADAPPTAKPAIIRRARSFYDQFLLIPDADKLLKVKAQLAAARLRDAFTKAKPEEAKLLAPVAEDGTVDLLASVDTARYRTAGKWRRSNAGLQVIADTAQNARLMLPATARDSYELSLKFTRTAGDGAVAIILPVGDRNVRLALSELAGKASGLYAIGGETTDSDSGVVRNSTTVLPGTLENDKEYALAVRSIIKGKDVTFAIDLNGERLIDYTGPIENLKNEGWSLREPGAFGLGASGATVVFNSVKLRSLRGDAVLLPRPTTLAERGVVTPADGFVDLLEIWDPAKDAYEGGWARELDAAVVDIGKRSQHARTRMPVLPEGDYTIKARVTCTDIRKAGGPVIYLPLGDTGVMLTLGGGQRGDLAGLSLVDGKDAASNDSTVKWPTLESGKQYLIETRVVIKEEDVRIEADIDGEKLVRWEGQRKSLSLPPMWTFGSGKSPAVGMNQAEFSYDAVEFRVDRGEAKLVRQPPAKAVVDLTPVDVLKMLDMRKHGMGGTSAMEGGKLVSTAVGLRDAATVMLPVVPQGNYELRFKVIRTGGRPVVQVWLPVAGTAMELTLGANDGKTGSLSGPLVKPGGEGNVASNSNVRLVNTTAYAFRVKVEAAGEDAHVQVELDGKPYLNWKGPASLLRPQLTMPASYNTRAPGFVVTNPVVRSSATFTEIELRMLTGSPKKLE